MSSSVPSPHDNLPADFSTVFGPVEDSAPSFDSSSSELPSFTPFLTDDSPLLAEATRLRRVELELKIVEERRRTVEAELALERLRSERTRMGPPSSAPYHPPAQPPADHHYYDYSPSHPPQSSPYAYPSTPSHSHAHGQPYSTLSAYGQAREPGGTAPDVSSSRMASYEPSPVPNPPPNPYAPYPHQLNLVTPNGTPSADGYASFAPSMDGQPSGYPMAGHRQSRQPTLPPASAPQPYYPTQHDLDGPPAPPIHAYSAYGSNHQMQPKLDHRPSIDNANAIEFVHPSSHGPPPIPVHQHRQREPSSATSSASSSSAPTPQHHPYNHPHLSSMSNNPSPTAVTPHPATATSYPPPTETPTPALASMTRTSISSSSSSTSKPPPASALLSKKKRILHPTQPIATCSACSAPIAKLFLRGDKDAFDVEWEGVWTCQTCLDRSRAEEGKTGKAGSEPAVGRRKRNRETQDVQAVLVCDVCMRAKGQGGIVSKDGKGEIGFTAEFVCMSCDDRYQRCTDCGGGGGGRIGIGKWRSKELFLRGRKTCSLAHTRIGSAPLELGVWEISELDAMGVTGEVVQNCERMWADRALARMAVPDVLEVEGMDRDTGKKVKRNFSDIRNTLDRGWPSRDHVTGAREPPEASVSRRYLGLTWVKTRSRRGTATDPDADGVGENEEDLMSPEQGQPEYRESGLPNVRKITGDFGHSKPLVIPPGSELVGLWVGDWSIRNGTLLISTSLPFEGSDGDDRSALTVGEIACRIVQEIDVINQANSQLPASYPRPPPVPPLEHLWVVSDGTSPAIRERMHDILHRKRQFLPLDEYLERHPDVRPEIFEDFTGPKPVGPDDGTRTWSDIGGGGAGEPAKVMVRWLGLHFDRQRLEELAGSEFGKKLKSKKKNISPAPSRPKVVLTTDVKEEHYPALANIFFDAFDGTLISARISPPGRRLSREKRVASSVYTRSLPTPADQRQVIALLDGVPVGFATWLAPVDRTSTSGESLPDEVAFKDELKRAEEARGGKPEVVKEVDASEDGPWAETFGKEMERVRRDWSGGRRHWYLKMLGVSPKYHGLGIGSQLLAWGMDQAAADGLPCWLESTEEGKLLYDRRGWTVKDWCELPDAELPGGVLRWPGMAHGEFKQEA